MKITFKHICVWASVLVIAALLLTVSVSLSSIANSHLENEVWIYTDDQTGLQYFVNDHGGMVPRLSPDGKHLRSVLMTAQ